MMHLHERHLASVLCTLSVSAGAFEVFDPVKRWSTVS